MPRKKVDTNKTPVKSSPDEDTKQPAPEELAWITPALHGMTELVESLVPDPKNARSHDEQSYRAIGASLEKFTQVKPIVCNSRNKQVVAGNGTWEAAKRLGHAQIAVVWVDMDPATQHGFAIADNRSAEFSAWDQSQLDELIGEYGDQWGDDLYDTLELENLILTDEPEETDAGGNDPAEAKETSGELPAEVAVKRSYQVVIECADELQQEAIYERLAAEGHKCRVLTL